MIQTRAREFCNHFATLPNQFTAFRLGLVPILWVVALAQQPFWLGVGLALSLISDALDGATARRLRLTSEFGAKIDSLADNLIIPSSFVWILITAPEIFVENTVLSIALVTIYSTAIVVGLVKFRRFGNLHLYSSKIGGACLYVFGIHALLSGASNPTLYHFAATLFIIASLERMAVLLTRSYVDEHIRSIVFDWVGRRGCQDAGMGGSVSTIRSLGGNQ